MSTRPKLLDLFCGQGGASRGYDGAGFDPYGVEIDPARAKHYPYPVYVGDAMEALRILIAGGDLGFTHPDGTVERLRLRDFFAAHGSPPCQAYTIATAGNLAARAKYPRFIAELRHLFQQTAIAWVIENVEQAKAEMQDPIMLCGRMFLLCTHDEDGEFLVLDRHRLFESNIDLTAPFAHPKHGKTLQVAGVYGGSRRAKRKPGETLAEVAPRDRHAARFERGGGYVPRSKVVKQRLLGIDWMTVKGLEESIPPAYAEWVGAELMGHYEKKEA